MGFNGKNTRIQISVSSKRCVTVLKFTSLCPCPNQVSGGELQHVWRKRRAKPWRGPEEEDRHRGHLHAVPQPWGEQPFPGLLFLPLPSLWKPHEQTQERHRTGELNITDQLHVVLYRSWRRFDFPAVSFTDVNMKAIIYCEISVLIVSLLYYLTDWHSGT